MSRISSSSFKVNSDLEQLVAVTNTTAIPTSDSIAQSSLSSIATNTTGLNGCVSPVVNYKSILLPPQP